MFTNVFRVFNVVRSIKVKGLVAASFLATLLLSGCADSSVSYSAPASSPPAATSKPTQLEKQKPVKNLPRLDGSATIALQVQNGTVTIEVDGKNAPITAGNFVDLVQRGVYDNLVFHRVVKEPQPFVAQGGDPQGKDPGFTGTLGTGGFIDPDTSQARTIPLEIKPKNSEIIYGKVFSEAGVKTAPELSHTRGAVAMARSQAPDSASSQFYIALADLPFLDGNYAVFGYVKNGMELVDQIKQGDRITSAKVVQGLENLRK